MIIKSNVETELELIEKGYEVVVGLDEAGRGPLAGPVVAGAVCLKNFSACNPEQMDLIRDSKTLSPKQRERIFDFIMENFYCGLGICDHKTIDRINILEASFLAMKKAITDLRKKFENFNESKSVFLVDGNKKIRNFSWNQRSIVGGDKFVKSVSAASIIAKVTRDRIMLEMHKKYPQYFFDRHKGYGTKLHMEMILKFGPSEIHRQSFEPMRSLAKNKKK